MESVYPLLALPKPLNPGNGRIQAKAVVAFGHGRKRKRGEIAAGIDGDSLNIYNIQSTSLLLTHAVSPHIRFTSPPCSVYSTNKQLKSETRRTYVTTVDDFEDRAVLWCYDDHRTGLEPPTSQRTEYKLTSGSDVLALDTVCSSSSLSPKDVGHEIIVAHRDGSVLCLPQDLLEPVWSANVVTADDDVELLDVTVTNGQALKSGFLRNREDVLAQLFAGSNDESQPERTPVIIATRKSDANKLSVLVFVVRTRQSLRIGSLQPLELLQKFSLTTSDNQILTHDVQCSWSVSTGVLHLLCNGRIQSFDFAGLAPRQIASTRTLGRDILKHYATNSALLFTQEGQHLILHDTKYGSIQGRRMLSNDVATASRKRKREQEQADTTSIEFIDHFPKLSLVLGVHNNNLTAIQLSKTINQQIRGLQQSRLIDSLHRGIVDLYGAFTEASQVTTENLSDRSNWQQKLTNLVVNGDAAAFDRLFADLVGAKAIPSTGGSPDSWSWNESDQNCRTARHQSLALFALSCIFGFADSQSADVEAAPNRILSINFFPANTFQWLMESGRLSFAHILQAQLHFNWQPSLDLSRQDMISAIAHLDPSLHLLCDVVKHSPHLDIVDLVQSMKHIIASFDDKSLPAPQALTAPDSEMLTITNGESPDIPNGFHDNSDIPNGFDALESAETQIQVNGNVDHDMDDVVEGAIEDLDMALDDLQSEQSPRGEALSKCLTRLNAHSTDNVTRALQEGLSQHEIIFLIHMLRVELAEGGWLSRYFDSSADEDKHVYNQSAIVVLNLINCALDAIGISGFLAASAADPSDSIDDLLSSLQAEHAAVMEGLNEAQFVNGALNTFLRFAGRLSRSQYQSDDKAIRILKPKSSELPLGLKVDELSRTRRTGGGQVIKRSKRDIGRQISMQVPLYSMERIRI